MRHPATSLRPAARAALLATLTVAVVAASGCSWFRKDGNIYAMSEEARPLEVPPDLDLPDTSAAVLAPAGTQSALRSKTGASGNAAAGPTPAGTGFNVALPRDQAFARVGEALAAVDGLEIATRAELLGAYDVSYMGSDFLVRVTAVDAGTYVSAVDPRGLPAEGEGPDTLMASLKAALGGR